MKQMNSKVLKKLENSQQDIHVTIYLPVLAGPQNTAANISSLHHTMSVLKTMLEDAEIPRAKHPEIIERIAELENELNHPIDSKSIVILIDKDYRVMAYKVPFFIEGTIYIMAPSVQLGPLQNNYSDSLRYWVLNISQHGCKLFKGNRFEIEEVEDKELAKDLATKLRLDLSEVMQQQSHSVNSPGSKANEAFNGQGGFKDLRKKYLKEYLRLIDKRIRRHVSRPSEPIILVGVNYVQAMYKKVSDHKNILASKHALSRQLPTPENIKSLVTPLISDIAKT